MERADLGPSADLVARGVLGMIENGQVRIGGRLPSERSLCGQFGVSRETVRRALEWLEEAGELRRARGRAGGSFALHPNPNWPVYSWSRRREGGRLVQRPVGVSVPTFLRHQHFEVATHVVRTRMEPAEPEIRTALALPQDALVAAIERVRLADRLPLSWERLYLPAQRFPGILDHDLAGSLSHLLADVYGVVAHDVDERVRVRTAEPEHTEHLDVSAGQPLLAITRISRDQDSAAFEFSYDLFRADRTELRISSTKGNP